MVKKGYRRVKVNETFSSFLNPEKDTLLVCSSIPMQAFLKVWSLLDPAKRRVAEDPLPPLMVVIPREIGYGHHVEMLRMQL